MIGRGLRPVSGKTDCLILDHTGIVRRLGFAADERCWSLEGHADLATTKAAREAAHGKDVICPACSCVYSGGRVCPECGHYIAPRGKIIRTLGGDLVEVGNNLASDAASKLKFYLELKGHGAIKGHKPGWAAMKYRELHGAFPPWSWTNQPAAQPSIETMRGIQSRNIAYARSRAAEAL